MPSIYIEAHFFVLINGFPSYSFRASRGLRQGCSLSPLVFILALIGLSLKIKEAKELGFF